MSNSFLSGFTAELARSKIAIPTVCRVLPSHSEEPSNARAPLAPGDGQLPPSVQLLDPAIRWNWPSPGPNQISLQQWNFCDTQPASCEPGAGFFSGTGSYSDGYRTFLELVDLAGFTPASRLTDARKAATLPTFPPSAGVGPPGFIVVSNSGGVNEFKPEWQIAMTPDQWGIDQSSVFHLDASTARGFLRGTSQATGLDAKRLDAALHIKNLARVPIYPGAWYSDSFVRLAAKGPFAGSRDPTEVIGPRGILRCRVTELFVGSEISASATFDAADAQALLAHLSIASTARIGSIAAGDANLRSTQVPGGTCIEATTAPGKPFIVAVSVQTVLS